MTAVSRTLLITLTFAASAGAAKPPLTYDEAIAANANRPDAAAAQEWSESVLKPFLNQQLESVLRSCVKPSADYAPNTGRLVIQLDRQQVTVPLAEGTPAEFPTCLASAMKGLSWPASPFDGLYLAVELNTRSLYSSEAEYEAASKAAAEKFMRDVTRPETPVESRRD
jgi:hypothetical protein